MAGKARIARLDPDGGYVNCGRVGSTGQCVSGIFFFQTESQNFVNGMMEKHHIHIDHPAAAVLTRPAAAGRRAAKRRRCGNGSDGYGRGQRCLSLRNPIPAHVAVDLKRVPRRGLLRWTAVAD